MTMDERLFERLAGQMSRGELRLFTGAGFSLAAPNQVGGTVPSPDQLKRILWPIAFPGQEMDEESSLGDIYECAVRQAGNEVRRVLGEQLLVSGDDLPQVYEKWFSMPWARVYTLNVDDLDEAAGRTFDLPRRICTVSALRDGCPASSNDLLSIHLNGRVADYPDITFSQPQYAERTARPDAWYHHLVADLSGHPIVFVGSPLDEPPLWQQLELRRTRERRARELRPGSYLVTPSISVARRRMLEQFNIQLVEMTQEEFADEVLERLGSEKVRGLAILSDQAAASGRRSALSPLGELRDQRSDTAADYLLGRQPLWGDIADGIAIQREFEEELTGRIDTDEPRVFAIIGTAGSGKSSTLMRLALAFHARGEAVTVLDSRSGVPLYAIKEQIRAVDAQYLVIDDADEFGRQVGVFVREVCAENPGLKVILGMRSVRFGSLEVEGRLEEISSLVYSVPHLQDSDIELLIDALERANRLGNLRGLGRPDQRARFRDKAGRQLLVAMIEATANERFEAKIDSECRQLGPEAAIAYSVTALATSLRSHLAQDEVLLATGDSSNRMLNAVAGLLAQRLLIRDQQGRLWVRHRVIADRAVEYYRQEGQLAQPIEGLLWAFATKVHPQMGRHSREFRLLKRLLSHSFMIRLTAGPDEPRRIYSAVEDLLRWDYHYYLQRGAYEVENGDLDLAKNFLDQARNMAPDDYMVQTEWAYMTLKRAATNALTTDARERAQEAMDELKDAIGRRGHIDSYPYHVIGSQGLSWVRRGVTSVDAKARELQGLLSIVRQGIRHHPRADDLRQLADDLEREYLMLAVPADRESRTADSEGDETRDG